MFEELSEKLDGVLGRLRTRGLLTEAQVREGLREVRRVLLEADVNFKLVKDFLARVEERATGEKVLRSVAPRFQYNFSTSSLTSVSFRASRSSMATRLIISVDPISMNLYCAD